MMTLKKRYNFLNGSNLHQINKMVQRHLCQTLLICLMCIPFESLVAQYGLSFIPGRVIKHSRNLRFDIPDHSLGGALEIALHNKKGRSWVPYYGYPEVKLRLGIQDFNNPDVLGTAFYIMPEIQFLPFKDRYFLTPVLGVGTGLGYISKTYDYNDNPSNNAISGHINNATSLYLGFRTRRMNGHQIRTGARLTHFSNARYKSPNLGINVFAWEINYSYGLTERHPVYQDRTSERYWFIEASGTFALSEYHVAGGPKYPIYSSGIMAGWSISEHQSLLLFPFWQLSRIDKVFGESVFAYNTEEEAEQAGKRFSLAIGLENRFHRLMVSIFWGMDLIRQGDSGSGKGFNIIRLQYSVPVSDVFELAPGLQFKSKEITAEYIALLMAVRLRKNRNQ